MSLENYQCKGCKQQNTNCGSCPHNEQRKEEYKEIKKERPVFVNRGCIAY